MYAGDLFKEKRVGIDKSVKHTKNRREKPTKVRSCGIEDVCKREVPLHRK